MKAYVVTGVTRGIGLAIAEAVVNSKHQLLSLSSNPDKKEPLWCNIECDLSNCKSLRRLMERLFMSVPMEHFEDLILINNAGVLDPMGPLAAATDAQILNNLLVNQAAPAILISAFIELTGGYRASRRIINISSGAARHPYAGWAMYCASKAALDMMTLCVAKEQRSVHDRAVSICSVSPGKVETAMQRHIRACDPALFPAQSDFVLAKTQGDLLMPRQVAELILALDNAGEFKNGGLYDLRSAIVDGHVYSIHPINPLPLE